MENKPHTTVCQFAKCENIDIELRAEVFSNPITKSEIPLHTRIQFIDMESGLLWGMKNMYFQEELSEYDIEKNLTHIAKNIEVYKEKK